MEWFFTVESEGNEALSVDMVSFCPARTAFIFVTDYELFGALVEVLGVGEFATHPF